MAKVHVVEIVDVIAAIAVFGQLRINGVTTNARVFDTDQDAGISLADLLRDDKPSKDKEGLKLGNGYLFRIHEEASSDLDLSEANISDTWTSQQKSGRWDRILNDFPFCYHLLGFVLIFSLYSWKCNEWQASLL